MTATETRSDALIDGLASIVAVMAILVLVLVIAVAANGRDSAPRSTVIPVHRGPAQIDPRQHLREAQLKQLDIRFQQAAAMLHAKRYEYALPALQRVLEVAPRMPEAHVNMGYALLGMERYEEALSWFLKATELNPYQGNAYWGIAVAYEHLGDLEASLGAMRTYIHLAPPGDTHVTKARSALWEWEETLKRGPLPKEDAEWLARRQKEWEERNSPDADIPAHKKDERIPIAVN